MKIGIFVSCPTLFNAQQEASRQIILEQLNRFGLEERRLGASDYPTELPLREVYVLMKHCSGGLVLGFEQLHIESGTWKRGTPKQRPAQRDELIPSAWNHLEAGVMFALGLPLLVFKEDAVTGGIFDYGVSEAFIHRMPTPDMTEAEKEGLAAVFMKWQAKVREFYYRK